MCRTPLWLLASLAFASLSSPADGAPVEVMSAPNLLRVGTAENIFVECQDCSEGDIHVKIRVMNHPTKITMLANQTVLLNKENNFQNFGKITIPVGDFSKDPKVKQYVNLQAHFPGQVLEKVVLVSFQSGYIFIQTDKTLYTPDSTGAFLMKSFKYLFGKEVDGTAYVVFGVVMEGEKRSFPSSLQRVPIRHGAGRVTLKKEHITETFNITELVGNPLYVAVSVLTESGSEMVAAELRGITIVTSPYTITFKKTPKYFKPGMTFNMAVEVLNPDKTPANRVSVVVREGYREVQGITAANGIAKLTINTVTGNRNLTIIAKTNDSGISLERQATTTMIAVPYKTQSNNYIHIEVDTAELKVGDNMRIDLNFNGHQNHNPDITYLILSRGQLVKHGHYKMDGNIVISLPPFPIQKDMLPSFRIIAYYHTNENEVVSDSVWVDVKDTCMGSLTLKSKSSVASYEPRKMFGLKITGDPGATVGLVAVDKGVYVLNNKHRLTQKKVWDMVEKYDTGCTPGGGKDSMKLKCPAPSRRKRAITITEVITSLASQYKKGLQRDCCLDGMKDTPLSYTCEVRSEYITDGIVCVEAFLHCCKELESQRDERRHDSLVLARSEEDDSYLDSNDIVSRTKFPESWNWLDIKLPACPPKDLNCSATCVEQNVPLQDSITTWQFTGISLSRTHGICVGEPLEVIVQKQFFIDLRLPYSAVRGEQIEIKAILHNYSPDSITASSPPETKKKKKTKKEKKKTKDNKEGGEDDEDGGNCGRDASAVHVFASLHRNTGTVSCQKVIVCQNRISGRGSTHSSPLSGSAKTVIICIYIQLYVRNYKLNYNECDLWVRLYLIEKEHVCSSASKKGRYRQEVEIGRETTRSVPFIIIPMKEGKYQIEVKATVKDAFVSDGIMKSLLVVPEGELVQSSKIITLNPKGGEQKETLNSGITKTEMIPNTPTRTLISVTGREQVGALVENAIGGKSMGSLILQPSGCGEQNMAKMTLPVIATTYLDKTNMWEAVGFNKRNEALQHIKTGYNNQLNYRKQDGSFAVWPYADSTTWLTAYVAKVFAIAHSMAGIESHVICDAVKFLILHAQLPDGRFREVGQSIPGSIAKAVAYLENRLPSLINPYAVAITSYALANENKLNQEILFKFASPELNHWPVPKGDVYTLEATAYALLALVKAETTIIVYQAIADYWTSAPEPDYDLNVDILLPTKSNPDKYNFNKDNHYATRTSKMVSLYYRLPKEEKSDCQKFNLSVQLIEGKLMTCLFLFIHKMDEGEMVYKLTIKILYKDEERDATMSILDIGLLTGFTVNTKDLDLLSKGHARTIAKYEMNTVLSERGSLIIYLDKVSHTREEEVTFRIHQKLKVGVLQPAAVSVYDYYDRTRCVKFYHPERIGGELLVLCRGTECTCAE
ncbi:complement C3-like, partial [Scomber scombrus]